MATFPFLRKKEFFSYHEREAITEAIRQAEHKTSGEVRTHWTVLRKFSGG
jgi:hypothetical protein